MVGRSEPRKKTKETTKTEIPNAYVGESRASFGQMLRRVDVNSQKTAMKPLFLPYPEINSKMDQKFAKTEI